MYDLVKYLKYSYFIMLNGLWLLPFQICIDFLLLANTMRDDNIISALLWNTSSQF